MHHWYSANLQQFYPLYSSIIFLETGVEILGLAWFDTPMQSEQRIQICFLYVQTKYKF